MFEGTSRHLVMKTFKEVPKSIPKIVNMCIIMTLKPKKYEAKTIMFYDIKNFPV